MKFDYIKPELTETIVNLERSILEVSKPSGAQSSGFNNTGTFTDGEWDID